MKALLFLSIAVFCYSHLYGQNRSIITLKAGTNINDGVPAEDLFQYPSFTDGKVYFRDGHTADAKLNYHRYLDEMQFVTKNGDTLTVDNEETIKMIVIANDTFYYNKDFVKLVTGSNKIKLGSRGTLQISQENKAAAYGTTSSISSIKTANTYSNGRNMVKINVKIDIVLEKITLYYFGDEYNKFVPASKKNLFDLFPKKRGEIKTYLEANKITFTDKNDLERLVQFLATL